MHSAGIRFTIGGERRHKSEGMKYNTRHGMVVKCNRRQQCMLDEVKVGQDNCSGRLGNYMWEPAKAANTLFESLV